MEISETVYEYLEPTEEENQVSPAAKIETSNGISLDSLLLNLNNEISDPMLHSFMDTQQSNDS